MDSNIPMQVESSSTSIEQLPLAERIKLAESFKPFEGLKPDYLIDAKDTVNTWCMARVLKADDKEVTVAYDGWSSRYDDVCFEI